MPKEIFSPDSGKFITPQERIEELTKKKTEGEISFGEKELLGELKQNLTEEIIRNAEFEKKDGRKK